MLSVMEGDYKVSQRAAEQIQQYVSNALKILESTTENINHADLEKWQKERILNNHINDFNEFHELTIRDLHGEIVATTRLGPVETDLWNKEAIEAAIHEKPFLSPVFIRDDLTPAMIASFPIRRLNEVREVLIGELNLLHMWYLVDSVQIGQKGVLHVVTDDGKLIASGDGARKKEVFRKKPFEPAKKLPKILRPEGTRFENPQGVRVLSVGTRLPPPLSWAVLVEQPTSEAYALAYRIGYLLLAVMILMLLLVVLIGIVGGKKEVLDPIETLYRATEQIAQGNWDYKIRINRNDEFQKLAEAFNLMTLRLKELKEKLILEERHALFGRIASGLAHDLKHPVQAIETSSHLMEKFHDNPEFRETFRKTVEREFSKINRFLEDLHQLTHDVSPHRLPLKVDSLIKESLSTFALSANKAGVNVLLEAADSLSLWGEPHSLNRVFSNLISNAIQAMPQGGSLTISVSDSDGRIQIILRDTGDGIAPEQIETIFTDFVTSKPLGLGLGLVVAKKIVEQHEGTIHVKSELGQGTSMILSFPKASETTTESSLQ